ncbi:MAG: pyrroloquinoline quinone-dependent dehydrogenase, partial [Alphaproteobacteria bacterium]|nr:pyrroloquinoline quinone-dependent dehydrogenase [Alphaproteobacteria bacterium]
QNTPTIVDGKLIVCTPFNRIIALDPATGQEVWVFDAEVGDDHALPFHYNCRGVAQWRDPEAAPDSLCAHRILFGTNDARMMAIDAATGQPCLGFGQDGEVRVPQEVDPEWPGEMKITSAPVIVSGNVVTGSFVMDNLRTQAPKGTVFAFDARTGKLAWTFDPIPRDPADPAYESWGPDAQGRPSAEVTGAANMWSTMVVDEARNLVFVPTSSAAPDFWGGNRPGENRYSSSVVALDGSSGEVVWHFQIVHHDIWDWDVSSPPMLVDVEKDGETIPAVIQNTKQGFTFILNRDTGEPIWPVGEKDVPQRHLPGEWLSPTQPVPTHPKPFIDTDLKPEEAWGFTFWDREKCREKIASYRYDGLFTAPDVAPGIMLVPGTAGGMNWGGPAYDPEKGWMIVNINSLAQALTLVPRDDVRDSLDGFGFNPKTGQVITEHRGAPYAATYDWILSPLGAPCNPPPWGELLAVDLNSGETKWRVPLGSIENNLPIPIEWNLGTPNIGGPIVTGGGLVFIGATMDRVFRAFSLETGEQLWRHKMEAGISTTPMTYEANGRQFVVIVTGRHLFFDMPPGDAVIAFALPEKEPEGGADQ